MAVLNYNKLMEFLKEHWKAITAGSVVISAAAICYYVYSLEDEESDEPKQTRLPGGTPFHDKVDINASQSEKERKARRWLEDYVRVYLLRAHSEECLTLKKSQEEAKEEEI
jgi:hypothetical protein